MAILASLNSLANLSGKVAASRLEKRITEHKEINIRHSHQWNAVRYQSNRCRIENDKIIPFPKHQNQCIHFVRLNKF